MTPVTESLSLQSFSTSQMKIDNLKKKKKNKIKGYDQKIINDRHHNDCFFGERILQDKKSDKFY